jgi:hypothetical protein
MAWSRSFAAFLAMGICVIASIKFDNPLNWIGATQSPTPTPLTAAQLSAVRQFGHANEVQVQTATYNPSLAEFTHGATALGIVIALSVLAMSVGLIRRTITAATAAALGLLGMAGVVIAGIAWTHSGLTATADGVPPSDLLILLIGLPLVAAIGGWLFAGREPWVSAAACGVSQVPAGWSRSRADSALSACAVRPPAPVSRRC